MKHNYKIKIEECSLEPLTLKFVENIRVLRNKNRFFFIDNQLISKEQQNMWYQKYLLKDDDIMFVILSKNKEFLGNIGLYNINLDTKTAEFGRVIVDKIAPKYTGTNAIKGILSFAKKTLGLNCIYCSVLLNNEKAKSIYKKLGFEIVKQENDLEYYSIYLTK